MATMDSLSEREALSTLAISACQVLMRVRNPVRVDVEDAAVRPEGAKDLSDELPTGTDTPPGD